VGEKEVPSFASAERKRRKRGPVVGSFSPTKWNVNYPLEGTLTASTETKRGKRSGFTSYGNQLGGGKNEDSVP